MEVFHDDFNGKRMARQSGVREVHLPLLLRRCKEELIAFSHSVRGQHVEADSLGYLSMEGLRQAVADMDGRYCYACYTAHYPTDLVLVGIEALLESEGRRR